jgi:hypothetical protein
MDDSYSIASYYILLHDAQCVLASMCALTTHCGYLVEAPFLICVLSNAVQTPL